jgi:glycosyltransferase involved in cell wall biosynthesis
MKILFLIEELGGGGKERRLVELLKGLSKNKTFEIHLVLTKTTNKYPEVNDLPIKIHHLNNFSNFALIRQYFLILKKIKPDVVHTWSFKTSLYASILKPFFDYKFLAGFVTNTFGQTKGRELLSSLLVFRMAEKILSNSKLGLTAYKVPKNKGQVIPNGFDAKRLNVKDHSNPNLKTFGINTLYTIIMVANVSPNKDYNTFIHVALEIIKKHNDVSFLSVGSIRPEFHNMVLPYIDNKHDKIKFIGFNNNVVQLIQESDIGLLCSEREGISNSILEYMAAGLPVITTDLKGASEELLVNKENGYICSKNEVSERLSLLLNNESLRKKIGQNNIERVKRNFSIEIMTSKYSELYKTVSS